MFDLMAISNGNGVKRLQGTIVKVAAVATLFVVVTIIFFNFWRALENARYFHKIVSEQIVEPVHAGGVIHVETRIDRYMPKDCAVSINRLIISAASHEVIFSQIVPGEVTANGPSTVRRTIYLSPVVVPGKYFLDIRVFTTCQDFVQRITVPPPVPFEVLP